jgi:predicted HicB family RNase H-like nuclease
MKPRRRTLRKETAKDTVAMNTRFHQDVHQFLRDQAYVQKKSMNLIIEECVLRYKKMLTSSDDMVP